MIFSVKLHANFSTMLFWCPEFYVCVHSSCNILLHLEFVKGGETHTCLQLLFELESVWKKIGISGHLIYTKLSGFFCPYFIKKSAILCEHLYYYSIFCNIKRLEPEYIFILTIKVSCFFRYRYFYAISRETQNAVVMNRLTKFGFSILGNLAR